MVRTDIIPEYGENAEKRIAKLNRVVARCKRYGIGVYVFFIDPAFLTKEIAEKHPDIAGYDCYLERKTFCTHSENGKAYCIEAMEKLCRALPEVKGYIDISYGERPTSCGSIDPKNCPRCKDYTSPEIVAHTTNLLKEGIRRAGVKADFISCTYGYRNWTLEETAEFVHHSPEDVIVMENYEDMGVDVQLGKERLAVDYWLSYLGPSSRFEAAQQVAMKENKTIYAKLQVCCSHECATLPYIPVPGILFDKYNSTFEGVMQCWYFGNYPSLMSKTAGELSFLHDFSDKDSFLEYVAGIYFGKTRAKAAAHAWKCFEEAYKNYPTNIMFSYYGPMHDGVVWELQLEPKNNRLPRTWLYLDTADGDRIYECMQNGHTIDEVVTLLAKMREKWNEGLSVLPENCPKEMKNVIDAYFCLAKSADNIMNFYKLRYELNASDNKEAILDEMERLVRAEMVNSEEMAAICERDTRLGYHSEAESFKFFTLQLKKRIRSLENLISTEFKDVRKRIEDGEVPLDWDVGYSDKVYVASDSLQTAKEERYPNGEGFFKIATDEENAYFEFCGEKGSEFTLSLETEPMHPQLEIHFTEGKKTLPYHFYEGLTDKRINEEFEKYNVSYECDGEKEKHVVTIRKDDVGWGKKWPVRFKTVSNYGAWSPSVNEIPRLGIGKNPSEFGRIIEKI